MTHSFDPELSSNGISPLENTFSPIFSCETVRVGSRFETVGRGFAKAREMKQNPLRLCFKSWFSAVFEETVSGNRPTFIEGV
jgi:hypothetical protein